MFNGGSGLNSMKNCATDVVPQSSVTVAVYTVFASGETVIAGPTSPVDQLIAYGG
jgi:hypothetical protein